MEMHRQVSESQNCKEFGGSANLGSRNTTFSVIAVADKLWNKYHSPSFVHDVHYKYYMYKYHNYFVNRSGFTVDWITMLLGTLLRFPNLV